MKKIIILLFLSALITSCGRSKSEQMLYDYQQKNVKALNFDLDDIDFEIKKIEKVADITAKDEMKDLKIELAEYWTKYPEQSLIDTLSFKFVKDKIKKTIASSDTLMKLYQDIITTAIKTNDYLSELEYNKKWEKAVDDKLSWQTELVKVELIENRYNLIAKNPDAILSTKYEATYSLKNPALNNAKQTFNKVFYTNESQTEFVKEEEL